MNDPLSTRLQTWAPRTGFDPAFSARVRARLQSAPALWTAAFRVAAAACVLLGVAIGMVGGLRSNRHQVNELLAANYARSIDPLQLAVTRAPQAHPEQ